MGGFPAGPAPLVELPIELLVELPVEGTISVLAFHYIGLGVIHDFYCSYAD